MKALTSVLLLATLATPLALSAKITRTVEKTFAVQAGGNLKVATEGGDVTVRTADTSEVRIVAKQVVRASTEKEADEILAKLDLTLEQSGNEVRAEAKYERRGAGSWFGNWPPVQVSFEVTVPRQFNATLHTSGGDVAVDSLKGAVHARTSGGNLRFARIDGEIDGQTSGGDIRLEEGTGRTKLGTSGGNITVTRAAGPVEVSTSGGDISIDSVAHLVSASTSGGNVRAVLTEPPAQDAYLGTSGGNVVVKIPKGAGFQLDASTSGGDVDADGLTITIEKGGSGKSRLAGAVNGGGPRLKLRSSGGDIRIRAE